MRYANLDFISAVEKLASSLGLEIPQTAEISNTHAAITSILGRAQRYYGKQLARSVQAQEYIRARGITSEIADEYALGYAPSDSKSLIYALTKSQIPLNKAMQAGLLIKNSRGSLARFRNRITFPIRDLRGNTVGFGGRTLIAASKPKYMNSPETEVFHKSRLLYGLYETLQRHRRPLRIVVVEGYMDVLAIAGATADIPVVATLGTAISRAQIELAFRAGAQEIVFCFDGDSAGQAAAQRALERSLPALRADSAIRFAFMPKGQDPDSLIHTKGVPALESVLNQAKPASAFLLDSLKIHSVQNTEDRARFLTKIKPYLNQIKDKIYRESLIADVAQVLRLPNDRVHGLLDNDRQGRFGASKPKSEGSQASIPCDPAIQKALALVIVAPGPVAEKLRDLDLSSIEFAGAELLNLVLETIGQDPHLTTAALLERWRDKPGRALLDELPQKYASLWRLAETGHDDTLAEECRELVAKLAAESRIQAEFRSLQDGTRAGNSVIDNDRLRRLQELMAKQKNGH